MRCTSIPKASFGWSTVTGIRSRSFTRTGTLLMTVGTGEFRNTSETFNGPTTVAFLDNGDFVVSDGYWNSRVVWFNGEGEFLKQLGGEYGRGPGKLGGVHAVVRDASSRLLVVDRCSGASQPAVTLPGQVEERRITDCNEATDDWIQIFDDEGNFLTYWTHVRRPLSLTVVGERIYAADDRRNIVILDAASGDVITRIDDVSRGDLHQIAVDAHGDVYAASLGGARYPRPLHAGTGVEPIESFASGSRKEKGMVVIRRHTVRARATLAALGCLAGSLLALACASPAEGPRFIRRDGRVSDDARFRNR